MHTTIVATTARAVAGDRVRCMDAGRDDDLAKPVNAEILFEILAPWTDNDVTAHAA